MRRCLARGGTHSRTFAQLDVRSKLHAALWACSLLSPSAQGVTYDACLEPPLYAVTDAEIDYLFNVFIMIDRDGSGEIDVGEFFRFFEIEHSPFGDKLFAYMGAM
jgi:hypothetical protein